MNRSLIGWILLVLLFVFGCGSSNEKEFTVLFNKPVMIYDKTVYNSGIPVGKVIEVEKTSANRSKVKVDFEPKFRSLPAENHVLLVNSGQLCLTTIAPFGQPLKANATLSGFASKAEFTLFRLKHLFSDKVAAARTRAERLSQH